MNIQLPTELAEALRKYAKDNRNTVSGAENTPEQAALQILAYFLKVKI